MGWVLGVIPRISLSQKKRKLYIYINKQGSRGTVIEATSRKDGKLKVKLDNDDTKKFRLIKGGDLQLYEGVASSPNSKSQTEGRIF
jgi:hypothetical protein